MQDIFKTTKFTTFRQHILANPGKMLLSFSGDDEVIIFPSEKLDELLLCIHMNAERQAWVHLGMSKKQYLNYSALVRNHQKHFFFCVYEIIAACNPTPTHSCFLTHIVDFINNAMHTGPLPVVMVFDRQMIHSAIAMRLDQLGGGHRHKEIVRAIPLPFPESIEEYSA